MVWAPDCPDLWAPDSATPNRWAPDSATPNRWAPDSGGHLTLGRAVDLFLAAKAAEGAAAKTLEWYGMILRRAVRGRGEDRPIEQLAGPELRAWILELRATLSPISRRLCREPGHFLARTSSPAKPQQVVAPDSATTTGGAPLP